MQIRTPRYTHTHRCIYSWIDAQCGSHNKEIKGSAAAAPAATNATAAT